MLNRENWEYLENKRILITGGTGSLGHQLTHDILQATKNARVIILSRDEFKQYRMREELSEVGGRKSEDGSRRTDAGSRVGFFLGDVRDGKRLRRAFAGVDYVIHTAALKQVPAAEY
ncbi:MAG: NAD-dependent epimerase/dehydratase family protein, partial [Verrucomicrobiae bacterium]|nr:NAD-dependent epimerase/dehydratase family protein [Verrucomicrobiae bacterium]